MQITKFATFELNYSKLRQHISQRLRADLSPRNQNLRPIQPKDNLKMAKIRKRKIQRLNGGGF
jgi:hypothetical protein